MFFSKTLIFDHLKVYDVSKAPTDKFCFTIKQPTCNEILAKNFLLSSFLFFQFFPGDATMVRHAVAYSLFRSAHQARSGILRNRPMQSIFDTILKVFLQNGQKMIENYQLRNLMIFIRYELIIPFSISKDPISNVTNAVMRCWITILSASQHKYAAQWHTYFVIAYYIAMSSNIIMLFLERPAILLRSIVNILAYISVV